MGSKIFLSVILILFFISQSCRKDEFGENEGSFKDSRDGHQYGWVKIGDQIWMSENIAYLPAVSSSSTGSYIDKHYYVYGYNGTDIDDAKANSNYPLFGVLYNWPAAREACPTGWHLPSDAEWLTLSDYLEANGFGYGGSGNDIAKSLSSTTNWFNDIAEGVPGNNPANNNSSGFSGLPGGFRIDVGLFVYLGHISFWWTATEYSNTHSWMRNIYYDRSTLIRINLSKDQGFSVRCIKDN